MTASLIYAAPEGMEYTWGSEDERLSTISIELLKDSNGNTCIRFHIYTVDVTEDHPVETEINYQKMAPVAALGGLTFKYDNGLG